jgi:hypothetical protein
MKDIDKRRIETEIVCAESFNELKKVLAELVRNIKTDDEIVELVNKSITESFKGKLKESEIGR